MAAGANIKEAKTGDSKTQGSGDEDLSMEEILQSIRRIIAEDDNEGKKPVADNAKANGAKAKGDKDDVPGSDVLELTEMLKDDGTVVSLKPETKPEAKPASAAKETAPSDVLSKIDEALTPEKPMEKAPEPAPAKAEAKPAEKPAATAPAPAPVAAAIDSLLSTEAASATADAFKRLKSAEPDMPAASTTPAPAFRDGTTVEDLVTEMLRPMMKAWLDANLPPIVERIVEREVKKLTR